MYLSKEEREEEKQEEIINIIKGILESMNNEQQINFKRYIENFIVKIVDKETFEKILKLF